MKKTLKILKAVFLTPTSPFCQFFYILVLTYASCVIFKEDMIFQTEVVALFAAIILHFVTKAVFSDRQTYWFETDEHSMNDDPETGILIGKIIILFVGCFAIMIPAKMISGSVFLSHPAPQYVNIGMFWGGLVYIIYLLSFEIAYNPVLMGKRFLRKQP